MISGLRSEAIKKLLDSNDTLNCSLEFDRNQVNAYGFDMNPDEPDHEFGGRPTYYEDVIGQLTLPIIIEILEEIIKEKTDESA